MAQDERVEKCLMPMNRNLSLLDANTIELHYWLKGENTHTMNAYVFNRCEYEFLGILDELSTKLKVKIEVEVEPLGYGGLRTWFKVNGITGQEFKKTLVMNLLAIIMLSPITVTWEYIINKVLDEIFEDPEIKALKKEKEKLGHELDIAKMKKEMERLSGKIDETKIKKKRSNYYENASKCDELEKITISLTDDNKQDYIAYDDVYAKDFSKYIMVSDELEPEHDENANIEIISPVLKRGKYQWMGIYQDEVIQFSMKSDEFKALVLSGQVAFNNGSSILCHLVTKKKVNSQGEVKITGYDVMAVDQYFINDTPIETPEGKKRRRDRAAAKNQLELFDEKDFD